MAQSCTPGRLQECGSKHETLYHTMKGTLLCPFTHQSFLVNGSLAFWFLPYGTIGPFSELASSNQLFLLAINFNHSFLRGKKLEKQREVAIKNRTVRIANVWVICWVLELGLTGFSINLGLEYFLEQRSPTLISSEDCDFKCGKACSRDFYYNWAAWMIFLFFWRILVSVGYLLFSEASNFG